MIPSRKAIGEFVAEGMTNQEIAAVTGYAVRTVGQRVYEVRRELGLRNRKEIVRYVKDCLERGTW